VGQLGLGDNNPSIYNSRNLPAVINSIKNIIQISSKGSNSMALNQSGSVFSFGSNFV
jgi:hypothetical protein